MWYQFLAQNAYFALHIVAALVCMSVAWLYLDAWTNKRAKKELFKWVGFGLLAISFLVQSTVIEQAALGDSIFGDAAHQTALYIRILAYIVIVIGLVLDPIQPLPNTSGLSAESFKKKTPATKARKKRAQAVYAPGIVAAQFIVPLGGMVVGYMFWKRATIGLERHLKRIAIGFFLIALSDTLGLAVLLRDSTNPIIYSWTAAFSWVWVAQQIALAAGIYFIGIWVWSYLTKRFISQFFMTFIGVIVVAFVVLCVALSSVLLQYVRSDMLDNLDTAAKSLQYATRAEQSVSAASAKQIASDTSIALATMSGDTSKLVSLTRDYLAAKEQSSLIITDVNGQVLLRAEDVGRYGDSLSSNTLLQRASLGEDATSVQSMTLYGREQLIVQSAVPIRNPSGTVIGVAVSSKELGTAFVDGLKKETGLDSSLYVSDMLSATTVTDSDGISRVSSARIQDSTVTNKVLREGGTFKGSVTLLNRDQIGVYVPVVNIDNDIIGMASVGRPETSTLQVAGRALQITFLLVAVLCVIAIYPAYRIARYLEKQI